MIVMIVMFNVCRFQSCHLSVMPQYACLGVCFVHICAQVVTSWHIVSCTLNTLICAWCGIRHPGFLLRAVFAPNQE
jgi:hypothetical protein